MRGALTHRLLPEAVHLTLTGDDGRSTTTAVPSEYLVAKCWGILADLDPVGVVEAALGARTLTLGQGTAPAPKYTLGIRILMLVRDGALTVGGIREALREPRAAISSRCQKLMRAGLMRRVDGAEGRGSRAQWGITAEGRAKLRAEGAR